MAFVDGAVPFARSQLGPTAPTDDRNDANSVRQLNRIYGHALFAFLLSGGGASSSKAIAGQRQAPAQTLTHGTRS
jgi:hypothetical protein